MLKSRLLIGLGLVCLPACTSPVSMKIEAYVDPAIPNKLKKTKIAIDVFYCTERNWADFQEKLAVHGTNPLPQRFMLDYFSRGTGVTVNERLVIESIFQRVTGKPIKDLMYMGANRETMEFQLPEGAEHAWLVVEDPWNGDKTDQAIRIFVRNPNIQIYEKPVQSTENVMLFVKVGKEAGHNKLEVEISTQKPADLDKPDPTEPKDEAAEAVKDNSGNGQ